MTSSIVNSTGLVFDIIGALLIWKFGLPKRINRDGHIYLILETVDDEEIKLAKKFDFWSGVGIGLLVIGFTLQIISN